MKWKDSLVKSEHLYSDFESPYGLPAGSEQLSQAHDPSDKGDPIEIFDCRFCGRKMAHKKSINRHEQNYTGAGGPKHICPDMCLEPGNCIGRKDYTRCPDRRIGNTRGKRGPKTNAEKANKKNRK